MSEAYLKVRAIRSKEILRLIEKTKREDNEFEYKCYVDRYRRFYD